MRELLKTDLRRMLKDKLFLIGLIIGVCFAIFTPILYKVLIVILENIAEMDDLFGSLITAKTILGTSFAPMSNYGLILPIFIAIIIYKDFSYGTIRNKIISGKSRISIYLSLLLSSAILMSVCMIGYALLQFGVSVLLLDYSYGITMIEDLPYILLTFLFGLLAYLFITSTIVFLCVNLKNVGLAIILYFGICFLFMIIATITSTAYQTISSMNGSVGLINTFKFLSNINIFYHLNFTIGLAEKYYIYDFVYILIDCLVFAGLLVLFGILVFKKKDLK